MPDQGSSYPSDKDIRERESQGEMIAHAEEEHGGIPEDQLLNPEARGRVLKEKQRKKAA